MVQDYHLLLAPRMLRDLRPDVRIGHFTHTPWVPPEYFRMLPDDVVRDLLDGLLGAHLIGFQHRPLGEALRRLLRRAARAGARLAARGLPTVDRRRRDARAGLRA